MDKREGERQRVRDRERDRERETLLPSPLNYPGVFIDLLDREREREREAGRQEKGQRERDTSSLSFN